MQSDTKISIVIPVLNQLEYTRGCMESLSPDISAGVEVVVVDNGSTDDTREFLAAKKNIRVIRNESNRGCACAWNQGVKCATGDWIVVLNNDVRLGKGWLSGLVDFAHETGGGVVTPAIREGLLNYEFDAYAAEFVVRMREVRRMGSVNGICFMVQRQVFDRVGLFDENFRIGQFEDADFFLRCGAANVLLGTTGRAFLHHFGSITQNDIRDRSQPGPYEAENRAYYRKKWNLTPSRRFVQRIGRQMQNFQWRNAERSKYGHSLYEKWIDGELRYF
jgi:N-acetylglucosaminyl-diphospho-decaprenol L-rhamnosyltransferase